ncbi:MAG: hypothetical protein FWH12_03470 [Treponema sp.]|nr:hypothetical protein [Treponema sp.]
MSLSTDWKEITYQKTFDQELAGLERRRERDPRCTIEDIQGVLKHLYIKDGGDGLGRGEVQELQMAATLAAHEYFIAQWEAEIKEAKEKPHKE